MPDIARYPNHHTSLIPPTPITKSLIFSPFSWCVEHVLQMVLLQGALLATLGLMKAPTLVHFSLNVHQRCNKQKYIFHSLCILCCKSQGLNCRNVYIWDVFFEKNSPPKYLIVDFSTLFLLQDSMSSFKDELLFSRAYELLINYCTYC